MISTRTQNKQTPFSVLVICGTLNNENGVIRKYHPGLESPTILRVPGDLSYRNAGQQIAAGRMEYLPEDRMKTLSRKTKREEPNLS